MTDTVAELNQVMAEADCLVSEQQVQAAIQSLADESPGASKTPIPCCSA